MRREKESSFDKIVERVSLSENENETLNKKNMTQQNQRHSTKNDVYRYFSQSAAKLDSDLFNYRRYFNDLLLDERIKSLKLINNEIEHLNKHSESLKSEHTEKSKEAEFITTECSRCRKRLEIYCKDCMHEKPTDAINQLQIEYNEPELPVSEKQQVIVYRSAGQSDPYSFNIPSNSLFDELRDYNQMKLSNYLKLYGNLRNRRSNNGISSEAINTQKHTNENIIENVSTENMVRKLFLFQGFRGKGYFTNHLKKNKTFLSQYSSR
jgi:hypothetical protein